MESRGILRAQKSTNPGHIPFQRDRNVTESTSHNPVLCYCVWPSLAVIGGIDSGLRIGGRCVDELLSREGTVLGASKPGSRSVKVLWDEGSFSVR